MQPDPASVRKEAAKHTLIGVKAGICFLIVAETSLHDCRLVTIIHRTA